MSASKTRIEVGFVSIPVRMEKATDDEESGFRTVCLGTEGAEHNVTRVKTEVVCPQCNRKHTSVYGYEDRAVEYGDELRVVTKDEIAAASGDPLKTLALKFHSREKFFAATVAADSVQNLSPDKGGERAYTALVEVMRARPDLVAVTIYAPRTKNALWVLEVHENRLVASKRCWPEDVRPVAGVTPALVDSAEMRLFGQYIDESVTDFDLGEYVDARRAGVKALIDAANGSGTTLVSSRPVAPDSGDLMAALEASVASVVKPKKAKPRAAKKAAPRKRAATKKAITSGRRSA